MDVSEALGLHGFRSEGVTRGGCLVLEDAARSVRIPLVPRLTVERLARVVEESGLTLGEVRAAIERVVAERRQRDAAGS